MKTMQRLDPMLTERIERINEEILIIDWAAALPRRAGRPYIQRQPIASYLPVITLMPAAPPAPQPARQHKPGTSTGEGLIWAATIVTFGPLAAGILLVAALIALVHFVPLLR